MNDNKKGLNFSDLFAEISNEDKNEDVKTFSSIFVSDEEKKNDNGGISLNDIVDESSSDNDIFSFNEIINENKNVSKDIVENNSEVSNEIFVDTNNSVSDDNLFVSDVVSETKEDNPFLNSDTETVNEVLEPKDEVEDNVFESSTSESKEDNSFLNSDTETVSEVLEPKDEVEDNVFESSTSESKEDNPFLKSDTEIVNEVLETKEEESNPFLDNNIESNSVTLGNNEVESDNPFFDNSEDEINPFFDNKIELDQTSNFNNNDNKIDLSNTKHFNVKVVKKKEPLIKFILGVLSYAMFIWLLLIGITLLVYVADIKIRAMKGDYSAPKFNAYVVLTGSMLPEIQIYDVVITKKVEAKDLREDDIITFASSDTRFEGTIITHRIINTYHDVSTDTYTFQTKGDNNNVADSALVQPSNIYGKVILKIPKLGYLQKFLASQGGWIIVILIPCLVVISYDIVKLIKSIKGKKYKKLKVTK